MHERAVDAAMEIECKKDRLAQNQDGTWKLTLTVAPDGLPDAVMKAAPGVRYRAFFVEVGDNEEPIKHAPAAPEKPKKRFHELPLSQQAALRCQDEEFQRFLMQERESAWTAQLHGDGPIDGNEIAARVVRKWCGVESRSSLDKFASSGGVWMNLNLDYERWSGLSAEERS